MYGKKTTAAAISEIFTRDSTPPNIAPRRTRDGSPARRALDDLTTALVNVKIDSNGDEDIQQNPPAARKCQPTRPQQVPVEEFTATDDLTVALSDGKIETKTKSTSTRKPRKTRNSPISEEPTSRPTRASKSTKQDAASKDESRLNWLKPLTNAYNFDGHPNTAIQQWKDILDPDWALEKIAESSYAEVYKVRNPSGTSILKIMALKPPSGPGSQRETAVTVESVVSEVLIMDMMAEIPGFLEFKAAHIIAGKAPRGMVKAFETFDEGSKDGTFFPRPASYHKEQLFLALELGDAGLDIEHFEIVNVAQLWDIFLRTTIAMASGEAEFRFEVGQTTFWSLCDVKLTYPSIAIYTRATFASNNALHQNPFLPLNYIGSATPVLRLHSLTIRYPELKIRKCYTAILSPILSFSTSLLFYSIRCIVGCGHGHSFAPMERRIHFSTAKRRLRMVVGRPICRTRMSFGCTTYWRPLSNSTRVRIGNH